MTPHTLLAAVVALLVTAASAAQAKPPVALDDRLTIELVAQEPQLVTPTGVACDVRGNVWVIESNTHFPPKDYKGHPTDRVWVFPGIGSGVVGEAASGGGAGGSAEAGAVLRRHPAGDEHRRHARREGLPRLPERDRPA
jgi:hypothetical protein